MAQCNIIFVFGNYGGYKQTWVFAPEISIKEMKLRMLKDNWPEDRIAPARSVQGMRFLWGGRELKDDTTLSEY